MNKFKNFYFLVGILISSVVIYLVMNNYGDNDMWFLLSSGKEIVQNGIPFENPFTYISGLGIVIQQWLWCVLTWVLFDNFGGYGLFALCIVLYFLVIYLFCKIAKINGSDNVFVFMVVSLLFVTFGWFFINVRPTMVTVVLLLWQIYMMDKYMKEGDWKILLWLIPISLLEINLHSSLWSMHFLFIIAYIFPNIKNKAVKFKTKAYSIKPFLLIMIPMFLVGFINPYGIDGILYLFNSYGNELNELGIKELVSPSMNDPMGVTLWVSWLIAAYVIFRNKDKEWDSSIIYLFCGLNILGVMHARNYIYYLLGLILFIIYGIRNICFDINVKGTKIASIVFLILSMTFLVSKASIIEDEFKIKDSYDTPIKAVEYIKNAGAENSNIFTEFNGGFFEYSGIKIFIDPRPELYMEKVNGSQDIIKDYIEYLRHANSSDYYAKFLDKYNFEYLTAYKGSGFGIFMENNKDYQMVVDAEEYQLYERKDLLCSRK